MKNKLLTLFLALAASVGTLFAQSGTCGTNLTWTLDTESGILTISGTGAMTNYTVSGGKLNTPWYSYRESIKTVKIGSSVTSIGDNTFNGCSSLTSTTIPNSVTSIGEGAFMNCRKLTSITIPNSVTSIGNDAFSYCLSLTSITMGNSVTSIGNDAFYYCSSLTSITIPNSVTSIGSSAFDNCYSLTSPIFNAHVFAKMPQSYSGAYTIPDGIESIGGSAFYYCSSLTSVTIPNSVTSIGIDAFYKCSSLTSVHISDVAAWCKIAFSSEYANPLYYAHNLYLNGTLVTDLVIPNSVTSIGQYAFSYCSGLTSITIPNSVTTIGKEAFRNCTGLTSVIIPNSVTSIGYMAFSYCSSLTSITIPNSVTSIGDYAFSGCSSLTSIAIPNSVTSIGSDAFYNCSKLTKIALNSNTIASQTYSSSNIGSIFGSQVKEYIIGDDVKSIGQYAFSGCLQASVTIPNGVTTIGNDAFKNVLNIEYHGSAKGSPWGAKCVNGYVDGNFVYRDATKTTLFGGYGSDNVTIPESITSIVGNTFGGCSGLTAVTIGNNVKSIGDNAFDDCNITSIYFTGTLEDWCNKSWSPGAVHPLKGEDITTYNLYIQGNAANNVVIPSTIENIPQESFICCGNLTSLVIPDNVKTIGVGAFFGCTNLASVTLSNSITSIAEHVFYGCKMSSITIPSSVTRIDGHAFDECKQLKTAVIEATTPPAIESAILPSATIVYVPLGSLKAYQESDWKKYDLRVFDTSKTVHDGQPTSAVITLSASLNGEDKNKYIAACGITDGEEQSGNVLEYIGLEPESEYNDVPFYIRTTKGDIQTVTATFSTSALTLTTLASKAVSNTTSILLAETNMSDSETSCGFEWRRNDQPADMPSNQVLCPVANGLMAGRLKGLKDDVYYKYRAFYKSAAGNMFYGDWQYVFTGDVTVEFDPVLYTYAAQFVSDRKATLKGYALAGSDDFTEQGFEYWAESRRTDAPARRAPQYAIGEKHTVKGTGISMRVTLEDLDEGTVYKYRTYAKVGGKTLYGSEMSFTTQGTYEEPVVTGIEDIDDADGDVRAPSATKVFENGQLYILLPNGTRYNLQGMEVK